jgi:hypothetical protein
MISGPTFTSTKSRIRIMKVTIMKLFPLKPTAPFALGQDPSALYRRFVCHACAPSPLEFVGVEDAAQRRRLVLPDAPRTQGVKLFDLAGG